MMVFLGVESEEEGSSMSSNVHNNGAVRISLRVEA